jgi:hypothetical protein
MTIDIKQMRAEIRAETRRFAFKMTIGMILAVLAGAGSVLLAAHLSGKI